MSSTCEECIFCKFKSDLHRTRICTLVYAEEFLKDEFRIDKTPSYPKEDCKCFVREW